MMTLCLILSACGAGGAGETESGAEAVREAYQTMTGCEMTAEVAWDQAGSLWETSVQCTYVPDGETTVEVLAPESIAGIRAVFSGEDARLEYEDLCREAIAKGAAVTALFAIPAREKIGRAKSVPVEEYPAVYAQIRQEMEQEIAAVSAQGGEF